MFREGKEKGGGFGANPVHQDLEASAGLGMGHREGRWGEGSADGDFTPAVSGCPGGHFCPTACGLHLSLVPRLRHSHAQ